MGGMLIEKNDKFSLVLHAKQLSSVIRWAKFSVLWYYQHFLDFDKVNLKDIQI